MPSAAAPVFIHTLPGWRARIISKSCSRLSVTFTGRPVARASAAAAGCTVCSILPPKAPPTCGVTQRTLDIGMPSESATKDWTWNTDWLDDQMVILPLESISASAEHGSI